jgi:phage tail tube protein FII
MPENRIITFEKNKAWINGNSFLGTVEEGAVEAKRKMLDFDGFAMPSAIKLPAGKLESMQAKLKLKTSDPLATQEINKKRGFIELKLSGKASVFNSTDGYVSDEEVATRMRGFVEEVPIPDYKNANEIPNKEVTINLMYLEVSRQGSVILKVDVTSGEIVPADLA